MFDKLDDMEKKILKVKKNINIFKKDKSVKIKLNNTNTKKKKSMEDALKANEVLLWGLNSIDSILLSTYENNKKQIFSKIIKYDNEFNKKNKCNTEDENKIKKTIDTEYIPGHIYNICDLDFLNSEYIRIEKKINQIIDLTDEYDNLLDLQDSLNILINDLDNKLKENNKELEIQKYNENHDNNYDVLESNINNINSINTLIKIEIDKSNESIKSNKSNRSNKSNKAPKKLKPYYSIGIIPEGFREATEEEAIINKKVSLYGKKRVQRELNSLFEITCTIYMELEDLTELNKRIIALKGKLKYYKKEIEYYKISMNSDSISADSANTIKNKISEMINYYKKTLDIYNLYVKQYNKVKNNCTET